MMKKVLLLFGFAAAMISFASCQKEMNAQTEDGKETSTFELVAEIAQTKTALDADTYEVAWEDGDVVYMVTSDGTWGAPYADDKDAETIAEFTYSDGKFTTEKNIENGEYLFKAMYTSSSQKSYHRGASSTHKLNAIQKQNCADPTAHIKANDVLVAAATATVPMTEPLAMTMSHLYTLMQVDVRNNTGAEIVVTMFEMTAEGADLAAVFNVDDFDNPAISISSGASDKIIVNITGGTVAAGASLPVYFVMAPLADYSGDVTFKVTDADGNTYSKTVTMDGISFEAGKYNTTPYTISEADYVEPVGDDTDVLNRALTGITSTTYTSWEGKTSNTAAVYAGQSAGGNNAIQLRSSNNNSGIVTTVSGGYAKKVEVTWNSNTAAGRTLNVYGKSSAYTNPTELYAESTQGTLLGTIVNGGESTVLEINGNFEYIGLRSASGAMYVDQIKITWSDESEAVALLSSISIEPETVVFDEGDDFVFDGVVTAVYEDGSSKNVSDQVEYTTPDMTAGTHTVTVTYTEGAVTETAEYTITVNAVNSDTETIEVVFSEFAAGIQYAENEEHVITEDLTLYVTDGHFTTQLRLYDSDSHDSVAWSSELPGYITNLNVNAGYKAATLSVYGSSDGETWTLVEDVVVKVSYADYSVDFPADTYKYFKLDAVGNQVRVASLNVTYKK